MILQMVVVFLVLHYILHDTKHGNINMEEPRRGLKLIENSPTFRSGLLPFSSIETREFVGATLGNANQARSCIRQNINQKVQVI